MFGQQTLSKVTVYPSQAIHKINPDFWGANFLYWIEDDSALADGTLISYLKNANVKLLRYPGGTVADNFHWRTATLDNTNMFPYESGPEQTSFDEFMTTCKKIDAAASCVLNTESWFIKNDIEGGAHEAAEWLRYCKRKEYNVKYWEIGNETYWYPIMSAEEYGRLVNIYADSMKKVDPNVILGINGHWDIGFVGTKERMLPPLSRNAMELRKNILSKAQYKKYTNFREENVQNPVTKGTIKWWQTLAKICSGNIDMIIIHWYFGQQQLPMVSKKILEVRELFSKYHPDRNYVFYMSEFNTVSGSPKPQTALTEMLGEMLKGKIDVSCLWPLTLKINKPMLLKYPTQEPTAFYHIFSKLSTHLKGNLVKIVFSNDLKGYAAADSNSACVVLSGRLLTKQKKSSLNIAGRTYKKCTLFRINGLEADAKMQTENVIPTANKISLKINPDDIVIAVFN